MLSRASLIVGAAFVFASLGCGKTNEAVPKTTTIEPWFAEATVRSGPIYLGNGTLGVQVPPLGFARSADLAPCLAMLKGRLVEIKNPLSYKVTPAPTSGVSGFWGRLDFHCGAYRSAYETDGKRILIETIVDFDRPVIAQRIWGAELELAESVAPGYSFSVTVRQRKGYWERYCVLRGPGIPEVPDDKLDFDEIAARAHVWLGKYRSADIRIDGPPEDERAIRSFLYYLAISGNEVLPPFGQSNGRYKGHRFWDAEAWMLPVIALTNPELARKATLWRRNAMSRGRIPWEAGPDGEDETAPEFRTALHQAGWVAWWVERAAALGLISRRECQELFRPAIGTLLNGSARTKRGVEFLGVESPDEGKLRNNDLITNLLAKSASGFPSRIGRQSPALSSWGKAIVLPRRPDGMLATYDNDPLIKYQQAAALLALYPLEWPVGRTVAQAMFQKYKDKASDAGPAMSDAIHATIASRLGLAEEALTLWRRSWQPFVRPGTMQFCERRNLRDSYFVTGAAGCLQTVIYGFLGIRIGQEPIPGYPSKRLLNGYFLSVKPCLPKAWKSITFRNIRILGETYTIRATHEKADIIQGGN